MKDIPQEKHRAACVDEKQRDRSAAYRITHYQPVRTCEKLTQRIVATEWGVRCAAPRLRRRQWFWGTQQPRTVYHGVSPRAEARSVLGGG